MIKKNGTTTNTSFFFVPLYNIRSSTFLKFLMQKIKVQQLTNYQLMKNKKNLYIGGGIATVSLIVFVLFLLKGSQEVTAGNPDFDKYISAYTSGIVSKSSSITVKLTSELADLINRDEIDADDLFSISPGIDGKVEWADDKTLEFIPDEAMPSDEKFFIEFDLDEITNVSKELESFNFEFKTIKQSFELDIEEQKTIDKKTLKWQKALGIVKTADVESTENIEQILTATQNGEKLTINWSSEINGKDHYFEIDSIQRGQNASEVVLEWDGDPIDVSIEGSVILAIPSIDDFKFMEAKVIHYPDQFLQIQFSDPIKENQNLEGLISIQDIENVRYIIDDNVIKIYPQTRITGTFPIQVHQGIKNVLNYSLKQQENFEVSFAERKPSVRLINKGVILPDSKNGLIMPFEAVNLRAVDVQIIQIFENNVIQFLQVNDYKGEYQLKRVGKPIVRKTVRLDNSDIVDFGKWNRFYLDLNELIKTEPGAIYRVQIGFRRSQSLFNCESDDEEENAEISFEEEDWTSYEDSEEEDSNWDGYENNDYYDNYYYDYNWSDRDDPCKNAYYGERRSVAQNIVASNIGLITKQGNDRSLIVFANDIRTTEPLKNIDIEIYNYQQQLLATQKTDGDGKVVFPPMKSTYFVVAKQDKERGYLKISDAVSLSLSRFDVSGMAIRKGLKGFIYGERGVWRPGDSIYLTFVLKEEAEKLPENHPIVFEFRNPQNQLVKRMVNRKNSSGFYIYRIKTNDDAPTGFWNARVKVGGVDFTKTIKIETVKPNRLKIKLDFDKKYLSVSDANSAKMEVKWLHGAVAKNLKTNVQVVLNEDKTSFLKYPDYQFDDPTKSFNTEYKTIFEQKVDENGKATFSTNFSVNKSAPGKLKATFMTKVFENGGDFSIDQISMPYYAFKSYTGIKLPKGDKARGMLLTDTTHRIDIVILDKDGKIINENHQIELEFYKIKWKWWWDKSANNVSNFSYNSSYNRIKKETVMSRNGKATWDIRIKYPKWGRYLVRATDLSSGHSTGKVVYIDWPGWAGRAQDDGNGGATMLTFTSDKTKYEVGESAKISIPSSSNGRALVSIENGTKVVETHWVETHDGQTDFTFRISEEMTPNVFINVTLLQPHAQTANDLPIRLYGIVPISVENPNTILQPVISMPDVLESEKTISVKVSEKNNKKMTYTIAVVDEGLLDLTRFETPNPWNTFFAKEALGVKTWDMYDFVIGAYGGKLERLLSIGGGADSDNPAKKKANRFVPVVRFYGPFELNGGNKTHKIKIPRYIGSVRTMVVAGNGEAFGTAEKATPVRKPLMLLGTLPRILSPGEKVKLPITIFSMDKSIKNVSVQIKTNGRLKAKGTSTKNIKFSDIGEKDISFNLDVAKKLGIAKVTIVATSGSHKATYDIELDVRNPNPRITKVDDKAMAANQSWNLDFDQVGISGTNKLTVEVSSVPPLNLAKRLQFLINYPYGCVEQTTSAVFPQLYLADLMQLDQNKQKSIETNIKKGIERLKQFQLPNGGLGYWPNSNNVSEWGTSYAGHFLIEAKKKGYAVSTSYMKKWTKYQREKSRNWSDNGPQSQLMQAYRLYTLALAGEPAKSAMNRLKVKKNLSESAKWRLAAAYALSGKTKVATGMIASLSTEVPAYTEMSYTYGSDLRDKAMILETLTLLKKQTDAFALVKSISEQLSAKKWLSTQSTAYALIAVSNFTKQNSTGKSISFSYALNGAKQKSVTSSNPVAQIEIASSKLNGNQLMIKNKSDGLLYARLMRSGVPAIDNTTDDSQALSITVVYKTMEGKIIQPEKIQQGTDFVAEVKVTHPGIRGDYKEMALKQIFPAGWEIINTRMMNIKSLGYAATPTFLDIRDDRVFTHFDLKRKKTKTFRVLLNASYVGKFYMPAIACEAMYDNSIYAHKAGKWVEVVGFGDAM